VNKNIQFIFLFIILAFPPLGFSSETKIEKFPKRIISLGPQITEEIYLLRAEDKIVGNTIYCIHPEAAKKKEKVGDVVNINIEKIISLKPDMVLATGLTSPKYIEKLKVLGLRVEIFYQPKSFDEICQDFIKLGSIIGREREATQIATLSKKRAEKIFSVTKKLNKKKVFVQIGIKPLFTVNKDSFINDFIEFAGGSNIAKTSLSGIYSYEAAVASDPEVIIIAPMGLDGKEEIKEWKKYSSIQAVKNGNIFAIDSYELCSPTPISFTETLKKIARLLHPEIKMEDLE